MKNWTAHTSAIVAALTLPLTFRAGAATFPGTNWETRTPAAVGLDVAKLDAIQTYLGGRGCIVRNGYLVYSWGNIATRGDVASAAKPWYSTLLFKAVEEGRLASLDTLAVGYEPGLTNLNATLGYKDTNITFRHFANQISGYGIQENPGTAFDYNDWQMALFWDTLLLKVYGATYANVDSTVLQPKLTSVLQCQDNPTFMAFGTGDRPGRLAVSPRDFARFGLLYLNRGNWNGTQVISVPNAAKAVNSPLPLAIPRTAGVAASMISGQRSIGSTTIPDNQTDHDGCYSWLWWVNGVRRNGQRFWPDAPTNVFACLGHANGKRGIAVMPSQDIVISWNDTVLDTYASDPHPLNQVLKYITEGVTNVGLGPLPGQIIVDPDHPNRMVYNGVYQDDRLKPCFFAGPGDPEDFFYYDTTNNLNLLKSRGARCTYITAYLQDFGGGSPGSGSTLTNILNTWETYITELENAGIITVFFFLDDSQPLPSGWETAVDAIVNRFKHHRLLIWSVAEEYAETLTTAQVSAVADRIKAADTQAHIIGVHQNTGTSFDFNADPDLKMFLVQNNVTTAATVHSGLLNAWTNTSGQKILNMSEIEDHAKKDRTTVRHWNWAAAMGGASAVQALWMGRASDVPAWNEQGKYDDCARLMDFMESATLFNTLSPHDDLAHGATQWALASPGIAYIGYSTNSGAMGFKGMTAGSYFFRWLDTASGMLVLQTNVAVSAGDQTWTRPVGIGNEAAVYVVNDTNTVQSASKPRLLVNTDIGGDPDDQQSLVRLMTLANEFDIEGLIATSRMIHGQDVMPGLITNIVQAYGQVQVNLSLHATGWPTQQYLLDRIKAGQGDQYSVGAGFDTAGSAHIISVVDVNDPRPVWVAIWGGSRELRQALWRVSQDRSQSQVDAFVAKLRVHAIADQDGHGAQIRAAYLGIFWIDDGAGLSQTYQVFRGQYQSGDTTQQNGTWVNANIRAGHGNLGAQYPEDGAGVDGMKEGDTPSFTCVLPLGLSDPSQPGWGGWGGRFQSIGNQVYVGAQDRVEGIGFGGANERYTVARWRLAYQRDFQARMDWCVQPYAGANHHPVALANNDGSRAILSNNVAPGSLVQLDAGGSFDPDGHALSYLWFFYSEAGRATNDIVMSNATSTLASFVAPNTASPVPLHCILAVTDNGSPALTSFRRILVTVAGSTNSDTTPPAVQSATAAGVSNRVIVIFSEPVEASSATLPANYALVQQTSGTPLNISNASLSGDGRTVTLATGAMSDGSVYVLTVNGVRDLAVPPNTIATNTQAQFTYGGLRAFYRFEEGTGTTTADASGNNLTGTLMNGPLWVPGKLGQFALDFDGSNDRVDLGNPTPLRFTGAMTIAAWAWPDSLSDNGRIITKGGGSGNRGWSLNVENTGSAWAFQIASSATTLASLQVAGVPLNAWTHVAGVYDPSGTPSMKFYTNGVLAATLTTGVPVAQFNSGMNVSIGSRADGTTRWNGKIDEVRLYSRALSAAEIAVLLQPPVVPPIFLPPILISNKLILNWTGPGQLQSAPAATGVYTNITPAPNPPYTNAVTQVENRFFRIKATP